MIWKFWNNASFIIIIGISNYFGIFGSALNWFQSQVSNCQQIIICKINSVQSDPAILCGPSCPVRSVHSTPFSLKYCSHWMDQQLFAEDSQLNRSSPPNDIDWTISNDQESLLKMCFIQRVENSRFCFKSVPLILYWSRFRKWVLFPVHWLTWHSRCTQTAPSERTKRSLVCVRPAGIVDGAMHSWAMLVDSSKLWLTDPNLKFYIKISRVLKIFQF